MNTIITISNNETKQFFFTTNHCQNHNLGEQWVPVTARLPMYVVPRESVPDGWVDTREKYVEVFYDDFTEIPNPDIEYQPRIMRLSDGENPRKTTSKGLCNINLNTLTLNSSQ